MGNYFSGMNCITASVITEINNDSSVEEVKKDDIIPENVKEPNPICDKQEGLAKKEDCCDKKECCDIEDCCKNQESCDKKDCCNKESCIRKEESVVSK